MKNEPILDLILLWISRLVCSIVQFFITKFTVYCFLKYVYTGFVLSIVILNIIPVILLFLPYKPVVY